MSVVESFVLGVGKRKVEDEEDKVKRVTIV